MLVFGNECWGPVGEPAPLRLVPRIPPPSLAELALAEAISGQVMLSRPGEGHPQSGLFEQWGVYVGSHGGHGRTLLKAMRACLMCCGLGEWWHTDYGEGELLKDFFDRAAREHLGRGLYRSH